MCLLVMILFNHLIRELNNVEKHLILYDSDCCLNTDQNDKALVYLNPTALLSEYLNQPDSLVRGIWYSRTIADTF